MKTTLLLNDEAEATRLMLKDVAFEELPLRDTEAHAGCNCDRWGHPCFRDDDSVRVDHPSLPAERLTV